MAKQWFRWCEMGDGMQTFIKILVAFAIGIALSACRVDTPPDDVDPPLPPPPPEEDKEEEEEELDKEEEDKEEPGTEEEDVDIVDEGEIDHEMEIIDALEIDPYWNIRLQSEVDPIIEKLVFVCVDLDDNSVSDIVLDMMNEKIPQLSAEHLVETAVFIICPEYTPKYEVYVLARRN